LIPPLIKQVAFASAFAEIQANQMTRFRLGGVWWMYYNPSFAPALDILNSFVQPFVERALHPDAREKKSGNLTEELAEFTQDPKQLRDQLVSILLAGRDSTASLLSFLFYELAYQPAIYARLRQEVLQTLEADGELSYANLKGMKYLQNCLNETLRLYPSVPLNGRYALGDTTLPHGGGKDGQEVH
jgi:cytochrome P450